MGFLFFLVVCLIVYGSLYPFEFTTAGVNAQAVEAFLSSWTAPSRRGDILGNIVLFVPFGLLGQLVLPPRRSPLKRFLVVAVLGFVLAVGVQVLQFYVPSRDPVLVDVVWNMVGLALGAAPAFLPQVQAMVHGRRFGDDKALPLLLVGCWIGSLLVPFVPSIDFQLWKDSLKPLLLYPTFDAAVFARDLAGWLAAACLGAVIVGERWLPAKFALVVAITYALKLIIIRNEIGLSDASAAATAVVLFGALVRYLPRRTGVVAVLLLLAYLFAGLTPFESRPFAPDFAWVPFGASLSGSMLNNAGVIAYKVFFAGALAWLLVHAGLNYAVVAVVAVVVTAAVEIGQLFVGDGTPEITDPLLAFVAVVLIAAVSPRHRRVASTIAGTAPAIRRPPAVSTEEPAPPAYRPADPYDDADRPAEPGHRAAPGVAASARQGGWLGAAGRLTIAVALIAGAIHVVLRLPGIPYNVRELFRHDGSVPDLVLFALAVLSIGAGAALTAWRVALGRRLFLTLPWYAFLSVSATHLLLFLSVTRESLMDVAGASVFINRIVNPRYLIFGDTGAEVANALGVEWLEAVAGVIEPIIRFAALFMPLPMTIAIVGATLLQLERYPAITGARRLGFAGYCLAIYVAAALPWYLLCKVIAFDVSSTDNLNELVARDGFFGLGGGGYLYLLLVAISIAGAILIWAVRRPSFVRVAVALIVAIGSLPLGWWLLNLGLEPEVQKYGATFSGVDFLLGPDRTTLLSERELMLRWLVVQGGLLAAIAAGAAVLPRRKIG